MLMALETKQPFWVVMAQMFLKGIIGSQGGDTDPQFLFIYPEGLSLSPNIPLCEASSSGQATDPQKAPVRPGTHL